MAASTLSERLRAGGIAADPAIVIREAQRAGLQLSLACALLEKETAGGHNVFGHDRDRAGRYIFPARDGTVAVTEDLYRQYKARRKATGLPQGVGPCQLTYAPFQEQADALGGCWKPAANIRVGFKVLADNIRANGLSAGVARYNGSGPAAAAYSQDVLAKARRWQALLAGAPVPKVLAARLVRRGDRGDRVERITRRLSYVHSPRTRAPYLDGARRQFDGEAVAALKAFQRDNRLLVDGVFGDESARRLIRAVKGERARRKQGGGVVVKPPAPPKPSVRAAQLPALVKDVRRLEADTDEAWEELVEYARKRARLLARLQGAGGGGTKPEPPKPTEVTRGLEEMTAILLRIEAKLVELTELEEREEAREAAAAAKASAVTAEVAAVVETATAVATSVEVSQLDEIEPPPPEGPVPPASANGLGAAAEPLRRLADLSDAELLERITRLDRGTVKARDELVRRYAKVEAEIARRRPKLAKPPRPAPAPRPVKKPVVTKDDPKGGKVVVTKLGDRGLLVKRSKLALARFLVARGNAEHVQLRRALRREARSPKRGNLATPNWQQGVKAAQHLTGRPVNGELDGELVRALQPYWPRDNAGKRVLRSAPGAWRMIPGQLTPNFNIGEFACKDAAHTGYVEGLMREQGLTKAQAKDRAKGLAKRLERLRKRGGDRPLIVTSAFRTRAYNASLTGSATNSAHTRGFAADTPPPRGVSLTQHEAHALESFECGVGIYPPPHGTFIHGDFDHTLGGRRRWHP